MNFMCCAELAKGQSAHFTREHVILVDCAVQGHHKLQTSSDAIYEQSY